MPSFNVMLALSYEPAVWLVLYHDGTAYRCGNGRTVRLDDKQTAALIALWHEQPELFQTDNIKRGVA